MMRLFKTLNQAGDTIIEVMVATTILALVLSVSFVSANRSLSVGTDAANRKQALELAQSQIELLRVLVNNGTLKTGSSNNIPAGEFCIKSVSGAISIQAKNACDQGQFHVGISYEYDYLTNTSTSPNKAFSVIASWAAISSQNADRVVLYYQDPEL